MATEGSDRLRIIPEPPWTVGVVKGRELLILPESEDAEDPNVELVATVACPRNSKGTFDHTKEAIDNARLIALAPDMMMLIRALELQFDEILAVINDQLNSLKKDPGEYPARKRRWAQSWRLLRRSLMDPSA